MKCVNGSWSESCTVQYTFRILPSKSNSADSFMDHQKHPQPREPSTERNRAKGQVPPGVAALLIPKPLPWLVWESPLLVTSKRYSYLKMGYVCMVIQIPVQVSYSGRCFRTKRGLPCWLTALLLYETQPNPPWHLNRHLYGKQGFLSCQYYFNPCSRAFLARDGHPSVPGPTLVFARYYGAVSEN